jgi:hypothetical protein
MAGVYVTPHAVRDLGYWGLALNLDFRDGDYRLGFTSDDAINLILKDSRVQG